MRAAAIALALGTACGSVPVAVPVGGGDPVRIATGAQGSPSPGATAAPSLPTPGPTPTTAPTGLRAGARPGTTDRKPDSSGDFAITVEVIPACVPAGTTGIARIATRPSAGLALLISYVADPERAGPWTFGDADPTGRYDWSFALPPDAPAGPADVLVGAGDWDRGDGATAKQPFDVGAATGC